jgi:xanthosine utilization system XapX-like protein
MRRGDVGRILMAVGVLCGLSYALINLSRPAYTTTQVSNLLMYTGIVTIAVGLIIFGASRVKSP